MDLAESYVSVFCVISFIERNLSSAFNLALTLYTAPGLLIYSGPGLSPPAPAGLGG